MADDDGVPETRPARADRIPHGDDSALTPPIVPSVIMQEMAELAERVARLQARLRELEPTDLVAATPDGWIAGNQTTQLALPEPAQHGTHHGPLIHRDRPMLIRESNRAAAALGRNDMRVSLKAVAVWLGWVYETYLSAVHWHGLYDLGPPPWPEKFVPDLTTLHDSGAARRVDTRPRAQGHRSAAGRPVRDPPSDR